MASVTIVSSAPGANGTGQGTQAHIIYASNIGRWMVAYFSGTNVLSTTFSSDFSSWSAGTTKTLANSHNSEGRNLSMAYANISSNDVVHFSTSYAISNTSKKTYFIRGVLSGTTTVTYGTETQVGSTGTNNFAQASDGNAVMLDSTNHKRFQGSGFILDSGGFGNMDAETYAGADTGSGWTPGTETTATITTVATVIGGRWMGDLQNGNAIYITTNGASYPSSETQLFWSKGTAGSPVSWGASANVFGSTQSAFNVNDWGACVRTGSDVHVVLRTGSNTYSHQRWNGTSWSAGDSITTQTSKSAAGVALVSNGSDVWMFIIDSAAGNAVKYNRWSSGTGWLGWNTLESSSQTRNNISVCPQIQNNLISVIWTQTNGGNFDLTGEQLNISTSVDLATRFRLAAQVTSNLSSRFRLAVAKDLSTRFRVSAQVTKDIATRFRLAVGKDLSSRFRLAIADNLATRFRLSAQVTKDLSARFRLALAKDLSTRFRLAVARDLATRLRLSATATMDLASRFRLGLAKDLSSRFRLAVARDVATRFRLQSISQTLLDLSARFRLSAQVADDLATRFRLAIGKDLSTRFRLARALDLASRFRLSSLVDKDLASRFRLSATKTLDVATRFRLATAFDLHSRFRLALARDLATRFRLSVLVAKDLSARFRLSALQAYDLATRFRLMLQGQVDVDLATRFRLSVANDLACRFRLAYFPPVQTMLVTVDGTSRLVSPSGTQTLTTVDGASRLLSSDGMSTLVSPDGASKLLLA